jgi:catechol 2,3-dioxygenase-like lactoylglutathione lyase family enzyme
MDVLLDHIVLNVRDIPASLDFYTNILQFEAERVPEFEAGSVPFPSVRVNANTVIDLFPPRMWEGGEVSGANRNNLNHFCLALEYTDWTALRERLLSAGIELHRDRSRNWGAKGDGISMYFSTLSATRSKLGIKRMNTH